MRRAAIPILLILASALGGCPSSSSFGDKPHPSPSATLPTQAGGEASQEVFVVQIRLIGIEVPLGAASDSEDLWSYVDEEQVSAGFPALGRNGFRVGVVRRDNYAALERILKQLAARRAGDAVFTILPNAALPIALKEKQPEQTLFVFHADRTLSGLDYPAGDNLLTLIPVINEDEPNQLILLGQPQIRSERETMQIVEEAGRLMYVMKKKVYELPDLTFRITVPTSDVLVIGPGAAARRPSSAAHAFLIKERDGVRFETVLVLVPRVARAVARTVPLEAAVHAAPSSAAP